MNRFYSAFTSLVLSCLLLVSCGGGPSASSYAKKFCECSPELAKAEVQHNAKRIDDATFNKIKAEHQACIGNDDNPLELLKNQPEQLKAFKTEFLLELEKQCPDIARNMNF